MTILQHPETTKTRPTLRTSSSSHSDISPIHTSPFFEAVEFRRRSASAPLFFDLHLSLICWVNYRRIHRFAGVSVPPTFAQFFAFFAPVALHIFAAVHHDFAYSFTRVREPLHVRILPSYPSSVDVPTWVCALTPFDFQIVRQSGPSLCLGWNLWLHICGSALCDFISEQRGLGPSTSSYYQGWRRLRNRPHRSGQIQG